MAPATEPPVAPSAAPALEAQAAAVIPGAASRQREEEILDVIEIDLSGGAATDQVPVVTVALNLNTEANRVLPEGPGNLIAGFPVGDVFRYRIV